MKSPNPRFSNSDNGLVSAVMKMPMPLVVAGTLALDCGSRHAKASVSVVWSFTLFFIWLILESCGGSITSLHCACAMCHSLGNFSYAAFTSFVSCLSPVHYLLFPQCAQNAATLTI